MKVFWPGWGSWLSTRLHAVAAAATESIWTTVAVDARTGAAFYRELAGAFGAVAALRIAEENAPIESAADSRSKSVIQMQDSGEDARELVADASFPMTPAEQKGTRCDSRGRGRRCRHHHRHKLRSHCRHLRKEKYQ